jgi:hypothetical protein
MGVYSNNVPFRVNGAATSGGTVNSGCYVEATYAITSTTNTQILGIQDQYYTILVGPGQTIPATITTYALEHVYLGTANYIVYTFQSGVEFSNA